MAVTLEIGVAVLVAVALLGDPAWAPEFAAFVVVTAAALAAYLVGRPKV
jgi:hypothetical protein